MPGDRVTVTYVQCDASYTGFVVDGTVKLTARTPTTAFSFSGYTAGFEAEMTGLSITDSTALHRYKGVLEIEANRIGVGTSSGSFAVPAGKLFTGTTFVGSTPVVLAYGAGTTFAQTDTNLPPYIATRKLDGPVAIGVGSAGVVSLAITTPTALSGSTLFDPLDATAGVIGIAASDENPSVSVTVKAASVTVSGDSDGNGSLDLAFDTTWAALTQ